MSSHNIPSDEDFQRAEAADAKRNRGLAEVRAQILDRFRKDGVHEIFVFYSPKIDTFGAFVFFRWDRQIEEAEQSGLTTKIRKAIADELVSAARRDASSMKIDFEFDSHESVELNYEGDYFLRLR